MDLFFQGCAITRRENKVVGLLLWETVIKKYKKSEREDAKFTLSFVCFIRFSFSLFPFWFLSFSPFLDPFLIIFDISGQQKEEALLSVASGVVVNVVLGNPLVSEQVQQKHLKN